MTWRVIHADAVVGLATLPDRSVQTCITSPPYFGLRDYGDAGQLGLESTPDEYVARLVGVFREVRRVLRDDGTVWLNLGDSYNADGRKGRAHMGEGKNNGYSAWVNKTMEGTKPKDLLGIPWMVAFALRADGWYLRSDIVWAKPNPMPESVTDRPTKAHEYLFLLSKGPRYVYDADAIREPPSDAFHVDRRAGVSAADYSGLTGRNDGGTHRGLAGFGVSKAGRNKRSVWTVATQPFPGAHFAVFPPKLIEPCVLAGAPPKCCGECGAPWERVVQQGAPPPIPDGRTVNEREDLKDGDRGQLLRISGQELARWREANPHETTGWRSTCEHDDDTGHSVVLDPFSGSGTTGVVALRHGRSYVGIELSAAYVEMSRRRICDDAPLFNTGLEVAA